MWLKIQKEEIMNAIEKCDSMAKVYAKSVGSHLSFQENINIGMDMAAAVGAKKVLLILLEEMEPVDAE